MQSYAAHIWAVVRQAVLNAHAAGEHMATNGAVLETVLRLAAPYHDLGKLDPANQEVLRQSGGGHLPVHHCDAGVAHLLGSPPNWKDAVRWWAALLIYSHHVGLPYPQGELLEGGQRAFRDDGLIGNRKTYDVTDERLADYLRAHRAALPELSDPGPSPSALPVHPLFFRVALSCLVDADHGDTASHYGEIASVNPPSLRAAERLAKLNSYVGALGQGVTDERNARRNRLRAQVYAACRDGDVGPAIQECDSPVGSGKTTAVMAHLLQAAAAKGLRRIFVVLPFTNIIDQSVETYRTALLLPDEQEEEVVAAHHHRAEFKEPASRQLSALWQAPVVVTTAVQFFETLASRRPAAVRKLHQLAGSAIFIDESHACLPVPLWPQAWAWLTQLAEQWGCHIVLGSGSLNRLWQLPDFVDQPHSLPALVPPEVRGQTSDIEKSRIVYRTKEGALGLEDLVGWLSNLEGPRLLIVNTVQTAAAIASELERSSGRRSVEHLSTALAPRHRGKTLKRVKKRLATKEDTDWTLVATSCIEAGVDLSFRTGLRERSSLTSLIQIGGRVNREHERPSAEVWDFQLRVEGLVNANPAFQDSSKVLANLFQLKKVISPELCTQALADELKLQGKSSINRPLRDAELIGDFPKVESLFRVIGDNTVTAVIDKDLQARLDAGEKVDWKELQQLSVQLYADRALKFGARPFAGYPDGQLVAWGLAYDKFLGYMAGALSVLRSEQTAFLV